MNLSVITPTGYDMHSVTRMCQGRKVVVTRKQQGWSVALEVKIDDELMHSHLPTEEEKQQFNELMNEARTIAMVELEQRRLKIINSPTFNDIFE